MRIRPEESWRWGQSLLGRDKLENTGIRSFILDYSEGTTELLVRKKG